MNKKQMNKYVSKYFFNDSEYKYILITYYKVFYFCDEYEMEFININRRLLKFTNKHVQEQMYKKILEEYFCPEICYNIIKNII
jgi:hypothetical protein